MIKDDDVLDKYNKIWNKIKQTCFTECLLYDENYIRAKVKEF